MNRLRPVLVLFACALALVMSARGAWADKKRVVVLDFKGPQAAEVQEQLVAVLGEIVIVFTQETFAAAAKDVDGFKADAAGVAKVASKLRAHAVLTGRVVKVGRTLKLAVQIRAGATGELVDASVAVEFKRGQIGRRQIGQVVKGILKAIRPLPDPPEEAPPAEPEGSVGGQAAGGQAAAEESGKVRAQPETPKETGRTDGVPRGSASGTTEDGGGKVAAAELARAEKERDLTVRGYAVEVLAGMTYQRRSLTFGADRDLVNPPQGYDGAMVPGVYVAGEVYPAALLRPERDGFLRHIGVTGMLDQVLYIKSRPESMDVDLPTSQTRFGFGLVYRWNFGDTPTSPTLKLGARFNKLQFEIDEEDAPSVLVQIPDVSYTFFDPGGAFRFPLTPAIAVTAEGHYLFVTKAGQIQSETHYGKSSVKGFEVDMGAEVRPFSSFSFHAGVRYSRLSHDFRGKGALTQRDVDDAPDVQSAEDAYMSVYLSAAFLY